MKKSFYLNLFPDTTFTRTMSCSDDARFQVRLLFDFDCVVLCFPDGSMARISLRSLIWGERSGRVGCSLSGAAPVAAFAAKMDETVAYEVTDCISTVGTRRIPVRLLPEVGSLTEPGERLISMGERLIGARCEPASERLVG